MRPYIGITDFTNYSQVDGMRAVFEAYQAPDSERVLHVGVMMSYKTLHGIPTKWQNAFPPKERIASIFGSNRVYNCLHYADYDGEEEFWRSLVEAVSYGGTNIHALQLDMIWPEPEWIAHALHTSRKYLEIILQIGANALEIVKNDPDLLVRKLENYDGVIHRVLLDKSMGRGLGMDAHGLLPFARAIHENFPDLGIGAAGGLGPGSVRLVEPFLEEFPDISIDAQSKLRPSGNALDLIAWNMASAYLREALELLEKPAP